MTKSNSSTVATDNKIKKTATRFTKFSTVAIGSAAVDWCVFTALSFSGLLPLHSQMVARVAGGLFSFISNKNWSFESGGKNRIPIEGRRFLTLFAVSYCLSISLFFVMTAFFGWSIYFAKFVSDSLIYCFNFVIMNIYVFHNRKGFTDLIIHCWKSVSQRHLP